MANAPDLSRFDPPEYLLARLNGQIREMMNSVLRDHGLKLVEWRVMQCLLDDQRLHTIADLAELAVIDRTVTSRLVDKMVARRLLAKEALEHDRRFMRITLTDEGRELYRVADLAAQEARARLFEGLADADVEELTRILSMMYGNATQPHRR